MTPQTFMDTFMGNTPMLNSDGQIEDIAYTVETNAKTAAYTVLPTDSGKVFTTTGASGAVTFTLPAVTNAGCKFHFVNTVNQTLTVASAEGDNMVTDGDAAADSLAASTTDHKIGAALTVVSDGTKWLCFVGGHGSAAWTAAT